MSMFLTNLPIVLCLLLGMALIVVEVFIPGFGLPGIGGIVLVGAGVLWIGMHFGALTAVGVLLVIIAVMAVLVSWVLRQAAQGIDGGIQSLLIFHLLTQCLLLA